MKGKRTLAAVMEWSGLPDLIRLARESLRWLLLALRGGLITGSIFLAAFSPQDPDDEQDLEIEASQAFSAVSKDGRKLRVLIGHVIFQAPDFNLKADRVLMWVKEGQAEDEFDELYAEGSVRYGFGDDLIRADQLFYDRKTERIAAHNMIIRSKDARTGLDTFVNAEQVWETEKGTFQLRNIILTSCEYADPHADLFVEEGVLKGLNRKKGRASGFEFFPYETYEVTGYTLTPRILSVPYFYIPYFTYRKGQQNYLREFKAGNSSRFGAFVESALGIDLTHEDLDTINPFGPSPDALKFEKWGEILLELDYRTERGFGTGIDVNYESDDYFGFLDTYYMDDVGPNDDVPFDRKFSTHGGRGRVKFFNRWDIDTFWRLETEASWLSDEDLLEEFFEKEFKEGKEQETTAYVRWLDENEGAFLQGRIRVNDFQTQTEYLPRASYRWTGEPIPLQRFLQSLTVDLGSELANLRTRTARKSDLSEDRTWRWDNSALVHLPMKIQGVGVMPFVGGRLTFYERDVNEEADIRGLITAGVRGKVDLHRDYDVHWDAVNLHGLRHVINFGAGYTSNLYASTPTGHFFPHDAVDALHEFDEVHVEMHQRLQTKVWGGGREDPVTFLRMSLAAEFYPSSRRDTPFLNLNNITPPFYWIPIVPDSDSVFRKRDFSNLHWDVEFTPIEYVRFRVFGEYNLEQTQEEFRFSSLSLRPDPMIDFEINNSFVRGVTNTYGFRTVFRPTEKWTFDARASYDTRFDEFLNYSIFMERDYHDIILRIGILADVGRDERIFAVEVVPKALRNFLSTSEGSLFGFQFGGQDKGN